MCICIFEFELWDKPVSPLIHYTSVISIVSPGHGLEFVQLYYRNFISLIMYKSDLFITMFCFYLFLN